MSQSEKRIYRECVEYLGMACYYQSRNWYSSVGNVLRVYMFYKKQISQPRLLKKLGDLEKKVLT
jgi:hypothetical protein